MASCLEEGKKLAAAVVVLCVQQCSGSVKDGVWLSLSRAAVVT